MKLKTLALTTLLMLGMTIQSFAVSVLVDGQPLQSDVPPQIISNRIFVPVSAVAGATGAVVSWEKETRTVVVQKDGKEVRLPIGSMTATKNGESVMLDVPAQIVDGRTMAPLSFIARSLDVPVAYDVITKTALIGNVLSVPKEPAPAPQVQYGQNQYKVLRVVDGDTIEIDMAGVKEKVRLIGIDTPESVHPDQSRNVPFGKVASDFTKAALEGKVVTLEYDVSPRDKYGRILAYVWIGDKMHNRSLVENGMARVKTYPPDVKYSDDFYMYERMAREAKIGIWENYEAMFPGQTEAAVQPTTPQNTAQTPATTGIDAEKNGTWIKGNKNSKIYHIPTGRDYDKVSPQNIVWFQTEADAQAAGYRRAKQ